MYNFVSYLNRNKNKYKYKFVLKFNFKLINFI